MVGSLAGGPGVLLTVLAGIAPTSLRRSDPREAAGDPGGCGDGELAPARPVHRHRARKRPDGAVAADRRGSSHRSPSRSSATPTGRLSPVENRGWLTLDDAARLRLRHELIRRAIIGYSPPTRRRGNHRTLLDGLLAHRPDQTARILHHAIPREASMSESTERMKDQPDATPPETTSRKRWSPPMDHLDGGGWRELATRSRRPRAGRPAHWPPGTDARPF
jgi:hypothetical protein